METKIIKAVFGGGRYAVTNKRTRTDYGQVLEFVGIDLPDTFECIFSNSATSAGTGKKMIGSSQRVLIPDEYLTTGQTIYAWILLHDTEDDGRHMYSVRIPVADMPDTSPEEPTPVEQSVISQAITALNSAVDTTSQKAQEATESADRAEQAAEGTEGYAERAEAAQSASESARDRATQAETSARTSAATATEKASEAISSATTASQSAITAETASESAQEYATASAESALRASQFAVDASVRAHNASEYAQTASSKASEASQSAQTASQKALEASQSASTAIDAKNDAVTAKTAAETAHGKAEDAQAAAAQSASEAAASASQAAESARTLTIDSAPTRGSANAVSSGGVWNEITNLKADLNTLETGYKNYSADDIIQGSYVADGSVAPNPNRIRIQGFIELNAGDTLSFKPGINVAGMLYGTYNESKVFQGDSPWCTAEHIITTDKHIYVICVFKNSTGTSISPADFDAVVAKTLSATNDINNLNEILEISVSPTSDEIIENRFITTNGILSGETDNADATDYLNIRDIVSDNLTIACTVYGYAGFAIYDKNKAVLLSVIGNNAAAYGITSAPTIQTFNIQRPTEACYVRLSAWKSAYTQTSDLKVNGRGFGDLNTRLSLVEREIDSIDTGTLSDKKVLVIGDSISTDAYGNYRKWVTDLINAGFFDGEKVTNSSQHATGFVARYDNQPNDFITRLKAIENPSQYDIVVVFGGINDYIQNIPMGEETGTDYTISFKPAVNEFFNYLIENFTQARLCVLLPMRTYATWQNSVGEYQQAYGDYINAVAKTYCLPVLNLTEDSGFFPWKTKFRNMWTLIPQGYDGGDGVHPNEAYQSKYLAPMIKNFLQGLL